MGHHHEHEPYEIITQCSHEKLLRYVCYLDLALNNSILLCLVFACYYSSSASMQLSGIGFSCQYVHTVRLIYLTSGSNLLSTGKQD